MVGSVLFNGFLHETRKRRKDVDGRVDLFIMKLSINEDLSFRNVASKIRNRVGDIVILRSVDEYWHGEDGNLGDGSVLAMDSTGSFIDC